MEVVGDREIEVENVDDGEVGFLGSSGFRRVWFRCGGCSCRLKVHGPACSEDIALVNRMRCK